MLLNKTVVKLLFIFVLRFILSQFIYKVFLDSFLLYQMVIRNPLCSHRSELWRYTAIMLVSDIGNWALSLCHWLMSSGPASGESRIYHFHLMMDYFWDIFFLWLQITADGDCSHEINRCLFLGRKTRSRCGLTHLDHILKSRDIALLTKVHLVKPMVFPVVMYGCESWTINKAEHWIIDDFELCCWRRFLRVPWTVRRSNQSILKDISPEYSLEGLMLKLKLQ